MPVTPDLATLQAVKEQLRREHPDWYPDFRDSFGNQLTEQLLPPELVMSTNNNLRYASVNCLVGLLRNP
jgi:hypothetical protein